MSLHLHVARHQVFVLTACRDGNPFHEWVPRIRHLLQEVAVPAWNWRRARADRKGYINATTQERLMLALKSVDAELEMQITLYGNYHRAL